MGKLSAFFEKSKRKPFKYGSTSSLQVETTKSKDVKEEEELSTVLNAYEEDTSEWAVPENSIPPVGDLDTLNATPFKVGVVDASSLKKEETVKPIEWKTLQEMHEEIIAGEDGVGEDKLNADSNTEQQATTKQAFRPSVLSGGYRFGSHNAPLTSMRNLASLRRANAVPDPDLQDAVAQAYSSIHSESAQTKKKAVKQNATATGLSTASSSADQSRVTTTTKKSTSQRDGSPELTKTTGPLSTLPVTSEPSNIPTVSSPAPTDYNNFQSDFLNLNSDEGGRSNNFSVTSYVDLHSLKLPYIEPDPHKIESKYLNKTKFSPLTV